MNQRKTLCGVVIFWLAVEFANWSLGKSLDNLATTQNLSVAAVMVTELLNVIAGPFGEGFVAGAVLFSAWNFPQIRDWLKRRKSRKRDKASDLALAEQCELISKKIHEQAIVIERLRQESFWTRSAKDEHEVRTGWEDARKAEAREDERFKRSVGHEAQALLVNLQNRGIKINSWGLSLGHHDLAGASYFFLDIADALKTGSYFDKTFSVNSMAPRL